MSVEDPPASGSSIHLVSWNVAGWQTTVDRIRRFKGGLPGFFERHHVDIFCAQETKVTTKQLAEDAGKFGAETPGFESFWACNDGSAAQRQGLNGVATWARQGSVLRADAAPLGDPELDKEGRCVFTDHGPFVLFNVYVPNSSGGARLPYKMRFLAALRRAMDNARASGKAVILAGDLNMKSRAADCYWSFLDIEMRVLRDLLTQSDAAHLPSEARLEAEALAKAWPCIAEALRQRQDRAFELKRNGQTSQRWGVFVTATSGEEVRLGPPLEEEGHAQQSFRFDGCGMEQDGTLVSGAAAADAAYLLRRPGVMSIGDLAECARRIAGIEIERKAQMALVGRLGKLPQAPSVTEWFEGVMQRDGMVDSFAAFHAAAEERFTCWDQYKNNRFINAGGRIDYILVDKPFFERHARRGPDLVTHGQAPPESAAAALRAATLGGVSEPAAFNGGGIPKLEDVEYYCQFRDAPGTGLLYTPPQLSDHIPVCLMVGGVDMPPCAAPSAAAQRDAATKKCQPHRAAKRISDFFARKAPAPADAPPAKRPALGSA